MWVIHWFFCMKTQQRDTVILKQLCVMQQSCLGLCSSPLAPAVPFSLKRSGNTSAGTRAFCTSEAQSCAWAEGKQRAQRKINILLSFFLSFWPWLSVLVQSSSNLAVERPFRRHTRSYVTLWVAPTCGGAIYLLSVPPSFILKQLFKSAWEARWEGSSLVYLQKLCWVISVYLRA